MFPEFTANLSKVLRYAIFKLSVIFPIFSTAPSIYSPSNIVPSKNYIK